MTQLEEHIEDLWDDAVDAVLVHIDRGASPAKAVGAVAQSLDDLFAFNRLFPGPIGTTLERHDGVVIQNILDRLRAITAHLKELLTRDPEKRRKRQKKREKRRMKARMKRASRRSTP